MSFSVWQILVLALVQGLTEFLPVSSTAHLKIVPQLLGWQDPGAAFTAVIQLGTLISLLVYFRRDLLHVAATFTRESLRLQFARSPAGRLGWMMILATVPIVVAGVLFKPTIETELRSLYVMAGALMALALALALAEWREHRKAIQGKTGRELSQTTWADAITVGLFQALALVPGASRSGTTITGGLLVGLKRETAARFSFLLSIPAVLAAGVFELYHERAALLATSHESFNLALCVLVSALVGYLSIHWFLAFLKNSSMWAFIGYRLVLGALLLGLLASGAVQP